VGTFEDSFASVGRWIDDRIAGLRSGSGYTTGERVRAVRESVSDRMRSAKHSASETIDRVRSNQPDRDDPRIQRRLLIIGLVLMLASGMGLGIWLAPRFLGISGSGLSKEDLAALQKMQKSGGTEVFVTTPPPSVYKPNAPGIGQPNTPAPSPPVGGGSLFPISK